MLTWIIAAFGWIAGFSAGALRSAVRGLENIIRAVFKYLDAGIRAASSFARSARAQISVFSKYVNRVIADIWDDFRWIVTRLIPDWFQRAVRDAIRWASNTITRVFNDVWGFILSVRGWLIDRINDVKRGLREVRDWLWGWIQHIWDGINALKRALPHVLNGPTTLAHWLIAAIVRELWKYVQANDQRIGRWVRDRSMAFTLWSANRLENIIARLL